MGAHWRPEGPERGGKVDSEDEEHKLGSGIAHVVRGRQLEETAVLSIRLPNLEIARLERLSRAASKTISEIVQEAVRAYERVLPEDYPGSLVTSLVSACRSLGRLQDQVCSNLPSSGGAAGEGVHCGRD